MSTTYALETFYGFILSDEDVDRIESDENDPLGNGTWDIVEEVLEGEKLLNLYTAGYRDSEISYGIGIKRMSRVKYDPFSFEVWDNPDDWATTFEQEEVEALRRVVTELGVDDPIIDIYQGLSVG